MSILIKNMKMPKNCEECAFNYDFCRCMITSKSTLFVDSIKRLDDCPLIEVPPRGDLIDRDTAIRSAFKGEQNIYCWDEIEEAIDNVPAIIESEE